MGELSDLAKKNSAYLKMEKGETVVCRFVGYRVVPNNLDPTKNAVMYQLNVDGTDKYWTNGNGRIMKFFDEAVPGCWVRVSRLPFLNKQGVEDANKSSYEVDEINLEGKILRSTVGPVLSQVPPVVQAPPSVANSFVARRPAAPAPKEEVAWDE